MQARLATVPNNSYQQNNQPHGFRGSFNVAAWLHADEPSGRISISLKVKTLQGSRTFEIDAVSVFHSGAVLLSNLVEIEMEAPIVTMEVWLTACGSARVRADELYVQMQECLHFVECGA